MKNAKQKRIYKLTRFWKLLFRNFIFWTLALLCTVLENIFKRHQSKSLIMNTVDRHNNLELSFFFFFKFIQYFHSANNIEMGFILFSLFTFFLSYLQTLSSINRLPMFISWTMETSTIISHIDGFGQNSSRNYSNSTINSDDSGNCVLTPASLYYYTYT